MRVLNQAGLSPQAVAEIESELSHQQNLKDGMNLAMSYPEGIFVPQIVADVVVQDEFTPSAGLALRDIYNGSLKRASQPRKGPRFSSESVPP